MKEFARRINFFTTSFVGILGISLISEIFQENDAEDKLDDIAILILSAVSIWWYKKKGHNARSTTPSIIILCIGLLIKFVGILIEHTDKEALGDDIGIFVAFLLALIFVTWQTLALRKEK